MTVAMGRLHITVTLTPPEPVRTLAERVLHRRRIHDRMERDRVRWALEARRWL